MKKLIISAIFSIFFFSACYDLDVAPKDRVTDDDLMTSESGMDIYMARMYSYMPFEEFKYTPKWGLRQQGWLCSMGISGTGEALNRAGDLCSAFTGEDTPYWNDKGNNAQPFALLRDANYLLETFPNYRSSFSDEATYNHYLGEAYFVRAMVFYAMAKRFGGVPLVTKVLSYPAESDQLEIPRASEEETWNQVLADFDKAAELLKPVSHKKGYSNKFVALSFKSEAMLYAGSVAKYNETVSGGLTGLGKKTGVRVIGFDPSKSKELAKKYFTEAYNAARRVMKEGGYSLYKKKWAANDTEAQYRNMVDMFSDLTSSENIYVKEYEYPTMTHGYDAYNLPFTMRSPLGSGTCPTLDFLELFDGFDRYPDGTVKVTTGISNTDGDYILYDSPMDFFKNAEPRLRAYVIFPGDMFKGIETEIRAGVYTGGTPIKPLFSDYSYNSAETYYQHTKAYTETPKTLYLSSKDGDGQEKVTYQDANGTTKTIAAAGANGPFFSNGESCLTGLYGRKWLVDDASFVAGQGKCYQPFILMRYGEILLNAAEAAIELSLEGVTVQNDDQLKVATDAINEIRERAGAAKLTGSLTGNENSRNIVRKERRKELAFEHKTIWDLRRWRVSHIENRDLFWGEKKDKNTFSNGSRYRFRGLYPFFSTQTGKYFFDARFQWVSQKTFDYNVLDYYFEIPKSEVTKSPVIDQQPNR